MNLQTANELKIKSRHKKSLSDNFNVSHEQMQAEQKKYYEMFSNLKDPEEFFKKLAPSTKSRFVKDFQNNKEDAKFNGTVHEDKNSAFDYFSNNLAIKNYNISPSNISSLNNSFTKNNPKSLFFNDADIANSESILTQSKNSKSPIYYVGTTPPGLTPKKNVKDTPKSLQRLNEENEFQEEMFENSKNYNESTPKNHFDKKNLIVSKTLFFFLNFK